MPKPRKIPMRMCVGCREMKPKTELQRIVKPQEKDAHIDFTGKAAGRGAYVCKSPACLKRAQTSRALERALSCAVSSEILQALVEQLEANE